MMGDIGLGEEDGVEEEEEDNTGEVEKAGCGSEVSWSKEMWSWKKYLHMFG